jgi:hypothetical protein
MSTLPVLATILNPLMPLAALVGLMALLWALYALARGRFLVGFGWLLLLAVSVWITLASAPILPPRYEHGAIGDCRSVASAEEAYRSSNGGSFGTLSCLASPASCGFESGTTPFLDSNIAALNTKQGYARAFVAGSRGSGKPDPGISSFVYVATPSKVGGATNRAFAIDSSGRFCVTTDGTIPPIVNGLLAPDCQPLK